MRKIKILPFLILFSLIATGMLSCKNSSSEERTSEETEQMEEEEIFSGELTFTPEAAVFVGSSFIYGVEINDKAKELAKRVEAVKSDKHDIVPVKVRGSVSPKKEGQEGWDEILIITQIIDVSDTAKKPDVRLK